MAPQEIRPLSPTDKDLHLSHTNASSRDLDYVASNARTVVPHPEEHDHEQHRPATALEEAEYAWGRLRRHCQDGFSEFFGTMVLILFGDGVVAQVVLSGGTKGNYQSISWCWGSVFFLSRSFCLSGIAFSFWPWTGQVTDNHPQNRSHARRIRC